MPTVKINGEKVVAAGVEDLRRHFESLRLTRFSEVWIAFEDGPHLCVLVNDDKAWLMHLRDAADSGYHSYDPEYAGDEDAVLEFRLGNGQVDEYLASWTMPTDEALRAAEHTFLHRERAPWINWHED